MLAKKALSAAPAAVAQYIEDAFSTYLYTGNGSTQTITNGIDLSGEGGMVWTKRRDDISNNRVYDTVRGALKALITDDFSGESSVSNSLTSFTSSGFTLGSSSASNVNSGTYASWTFRKAEKFFDVVTYTGNGTAGRTVSHSLGSTPGCILVKKTSGGDDWAVYHRSIGETKYLVLNTTEAENTGSGYWNNTAPTSSTFTLGTDSKVNTNNQTYVAYLFAHDAGGFGEDSDQSVISCGTFTTNGSEASTTTLGWEPQWLLLKRTDSTSNWFLADNMRGLNVAGIDDYFLNPNLTAAESNNNRIGLTSTGFTTSGFGVSATFVYIAIRRGPMKTPEVGTEVFKAVTRTGTGASATVTGVGFSPDFSLVGIRTGSPYNGTLYDRLRGPGYRIGTRSTAAEGYDSDTLTSFNMDGVSLGADYFGYINTSGGTDYVNWYLKRAPGFFDVVCYTGTGSNTTVTHNLGVAPEFIALKRRDTTSSWACQHTGVSAAKNFSLNSADPASNASTIWNSTAATSTSFSVGTSGTTNASGGTYVAYLFASVTGVSKVGSYTGTGTTLQINCGFTGGARFVLIKRTDDTGDWYVWDTARGIVSGNDPYLLLNSTAAEVTNTDYIDTYSSGFEISSTAPAAINANGGTFIYLAIA